MGAALGADAAHTLEVRVYQPQVKLTAGSLIFARLNSAAQGVVKYRVWGQPQPIGILADDVITISFHTAKSEALFERKRCEDFAEVHLPWQLVLEEAPDEDTEAFFDLALFPGKSSLGEDAPSWQYCDAFRRSREVAKEDPLAQRVSVGIRRSREGPPVSVRNSSNVDLSAKNSSVGVSGSRTSTPSSAITYGVEELNPDEMKLLLKLQMRNQDLRSKLGVNDNDLPQIDEQMQAHLAAVNCAITESYLLKSHVQALDKELTSLCVGLDSNQYCALSMETLQMQRESPHVFGGASVDNHGITSGAESPAELVSQIRRITQDNMELISVGEVQIQMLETQLVSAAPRQQRVAGQQSTVALGQNGSDAEARIQERRQTLEQQVRELEQIEAECLRYQEEAAQEYAKKEHTERHLIQKLELEHDVQREEIGKLQEMLQRHGTEGAPVPPGTGVLQSEVGQLQFQIAENRRRNTQEQDDLQNAADELRRDTLHLQEEFQRITQLCAACEVELEEIRQANSESTDPAKEREELLRVRNTVVNEIARSRQRMEFYDVKVSALREEEEDLQRRASGLARFVSIPKDGGSASPPQSAKALSLEGTISELQHQVLEERREEEQLRVMHEEARRALETAEVEAKVMEQRARLLRSRGTVTAALSSQLSPPRVPLTSPPVG